MFVKPAPATDAPTDVHVSALPVGLLMTKVFDSSAMQMANSKLPAGFVKLAVVVGFAVPETNPGVDASSATVTARTPP